MRRVGLAVPAKAELVSRLEAAVVNSERKGYHGRSSKGGKGMGKGGYGGNGGRGGGRRYGSRY